MVNSGMDENLAVIDKDLAVELAGNNPEIAEEIFQMLIDALPDDCQEIEKAYDKKDWPAMGDQVHKLHGATCYCGVPALKAAAGHLERIIKDKSPEEEIDLAYNKFKTEVKRLLEATN